MYKKSSVVSSSKKVEQKVKEINPTFTFTKGHNPLYISRRQSWLEHEHIDNGCNSSNRCDLLFRLFHLDRSLLQVCQIILVQMQWQLLYTCLLMF